MRGQYDVSISRSRLATAGEYSMSAADLFISFPFVWQNVMRKTVMCWGKLHLRVQRSVQRCVFNASHVKRCPYLWDFEEEEEKEIQFIKEGGGKGGTVH